MKIEQNIKEMIFNLFKNKVEIYLQTVGGKWYEQKYEKTETIEPLKIYGIKINGGSYIDYCFNSPKKEDSILKSFLSQYVTKYETKQSELSKDGLLIKQSKESIYAKIKNSDRVENWVFYTTLYGIGTFCFFMSAKTLKGVHLKMAEYLKSKGIDFKNEFSDAGWVYRFVINKPVEIHNNLLSEFKN